MQTCENAWHAEQNALEVYYLELHSQFLNLFGSTTSSVGPEKDSQIRQEKRMKAAGERALAHLRKKPKF